MIRDQTDNAQPRQRRRGCCGGLLLVLTVVTAFAGLAVWFSNRPSGAVQYSVVNDSSEPIQITHLIFNHENVMHEPWTMLPKRRNDSIQLISEYVLGGYTYVIPTSFEIKISYTLIESRKRFEKKFVVELTERMCWFNITIGESGAAISECRLSEHLDSD